MRLYLVAVGTRLPAWQQEGFAEYTRRLPRECALELVEIPAARRSKSSHTRRAVETEGERMLSALPRDTHVVALDQDGRSHSTEELARLLSRWLEGGRDVALLVGGADGLAPDCLARAEARWSLSPLTLPHGLVRVLVAEQLYRAWSILQGHPYHRGDT
jgi:23S rRNA (pseudouridine1915-N3)-methyltransferase